MDEMFVPYKSTLESIPESIPQVTSASSFSLWVWIASAVVFILIVLGVFFMRYQSTVKLEKQSILPLTHTQPNTVLKQKLPEVSLLPPVIDFSVPAKLNTEKMNKEELAKFVGTEIKNLLVLYSGISSLQTASIVSFSVRTMLEDFAPVLQPQSLPATKPPLEKLDEEFISTKVMQPRAQPTHAQLDADEEEETKDPPKKGKINADTDANLLLMLKQRGLSN